MALILGSRTEPALPLARLRAHGELGEIGAGDLRFDEATVFALAQGRWGSTPAPEMVRDALQRTRGWAVGVNLLLASSTGTGIVRPDLQRGAPPKALFDFLAHEVLEELPEDLRRFAVDCAVLPDLNPRRCQAVTLPRRQPRGARRAAAAPPVPERGRGTRAGAALSRPVPRFCAPSWRASRPNINGSCTSVRPQPKTSRTGRSAIGWMPSAGTRRPR